MKKNTPDKSNCRCKGTTILRHTQNFCRHFADIGVLECKRMYKKSRAQARI